MDNLVDFVYRKFLVPVYNKYDKKYDQLQFKIHCFRMASFLCILIALKSGLVGSFVGVAINMFLAYFLYNEAEKKETNHMAENIFGFIFIFSLVGLCLFLLLSVLAQELNLISFVSVFMDFILWYLITLGYFVFYENNKQNRNKK